MNALYRRDPRHSWSPAMAHYWPGTAGKPDDLLDLTPAQLEALEVSLEKTLDN